MLKITNLFAIIIFLVCYGLVACSTGPNAANCYGNGQAGCESYWKEEKPKLVKVEPKIDEDYARKFKIKDLEKYKNIREIGASSWRKVGLSHFDNEKALLECGVGVYWIKGAREKMETLPLSKYNDGIVEIKKCMLNDDFKYLGKFDPCTPDSTLPACQTSTPTPMRSISTRIEGAYCLTEPTLHECEPQSYERRINSTYCKKYPQRDVCQEYEQKLFCSKFPKADKCQPYEGTHIPQTKETGEVDKVTLSPLKTDIAKNAADSNDNKLLEILFPTFFHSHPIDPNSQKHLTRELEKQQFQQDMQKQNDRQMKDLLRSTTPKTGR